MLNLIYNLKVSNKANWYYQLNLKNLDFYLKINKMVESSDPDFELPQEEDNEENDLIIF